MAPIRLLLIDDEAEFTDLLQLNFSRDERFVTEVENNPLHALSTAQKFRPDVILLDIVMPGADGGDVRVSLQSDSLLRRVPVILVSALVQHQDTDPDAVVETSDGIIIAKPVRMPHLITCIEEALGTKLPVR
ncbi:MAG: response regulator [Verrucomicrobiota bacterium]